MDEVTSLLDERTGLVAELRPHRLHPRLPAALRMWTARLADSQQFTPWPSDPVTTGCTWSDDTQARMAALGEAVERYCGALIPPGLTRVTAVQLRARGHRVLDLAALALFSAGQYRTPGFPFVAFEPDLPVRWVSGCDLATGELCAVPASLVYTTFHRGLPGRDGLLPYGDEPPTSPVPYAGLAAGRSREQAELAALLELIERDAVTRSWLRGQQWPEIELPAALDNLFRGPHEALRVRLFHVPDAVGVPVLAALVEDLVTDLLALGTAARPDPRRAALKAVAEAVQLHLMLHELDDRGSALMRMARTHAGCPLRPWRADHRYRASYRSDWRDVRDLACQLQLYLDPAMRAALRERMAGRPTIPLASLPTSPAASARDLVQALIRIGIHPVKVDVTTSDVRRAGWWAVRVVAAGLYPNTPAAFPPLGGRRLREKEWTLMESPLPLPYA
ncbi:MAG: YcaO-like family protein [Pseudonocardiaceae bacterium]